MAAQVLHSSFSLGTFVDVPFHSSTSTCDVTFATKNLPTRTDVFPSSSDALLPPPALLVVLSRLLLRGAGRTIALMGRCGSVPGDDGGEPAISGKPGRLGLIGNKPVYFAAT